MKLTWDQAFTWLTSGDAVGLCSDTRARGLLASSRDLIVASLVNQRDHTTPGRILFYDPDDDTYEVRDNFPRPTTPAAVAYSMGRAGYQLAARGVTGWRTLWDEVPTTGVQAVRVELPGTGETEVRAVATALARSGWTAEYIPAPAGAPAVTGVTGWLRVTQNGPQPVDSPVDDGG